MVDKCENACYYIDVPDRVRHKERVVDMTEEQRTMAFSMLKNLYSQVCYVIAEKGTWQNDEGKIWRASYNAAVDMIEVLYGADIAWELRDAARRCAELDVLGF